LAKVVEKMAYKQKGIVKAFYLFGVGGERFLVG
jgi:hypothetical protein